MDLTKQTDIEIKALIYDESTKIQIAQNNINIANQELANRQKQPSQPKAVEKEEKEK